MNSISDLSFASHANVFSGALSLEAVRQQAPAVFAPSAHEHLSSRYTFIPTERVLVGLLQAGFVPVDARHVLRLRRRFETVQLKDAVPEVVFLNSHDGSSAYQLRMGIFRVVCTNGLVVSRGAFPTQCVSHRGDVVDDVVAGALALAERFPVLAVQVERMEQRRLGSEEQIRFAERALAVRYRDPSVAGMPASRLLTCRRVEDGGDDLWSILNRCQENLLAGGLSRRSAQGRVVRTRRISAIREGIRINGALWDLASEVLGG